MLTVEVDPWGRRPSCSTLSTSCIIVLIMPLIS